MTPFQVKTCALSAISLGESASNLQEFREKLKNIPKESIYYHFWGERLYSQFTHPEFHNGFAVWAHTSLHDEILAERLSILDPTEFSDLDHLRDRILQIVDQRLQESTAITVINPQERFFFIRSILLVVPTKLIMNDPKDLPSALRQMSKSNIYYHFIDARRRTDEKVDDFTLWIQTFGDKYQRLIEEIRKIDPYYRSLSQLHEKLTECAEDYFGVKP